MTKSTKNEFLSILKNKKVLIPVLAVLFIPLLYSFMFLWTFWDPYSKMDQLPVAVVNLDEGSELNGEEINIGEDFIDELRENDSFKWEFISEEEAEQRLGNNELYMAVKIPSDFSSKATTIVEDEPMQAELIFVPNESYNFLSSQIGKTAIESIQTELSNKLTEAYAETVYENIVDLSDGLNTAADGATSITDGSLEISDGVSEVNMNLSDLANATIDLKTGMTSLVVGSKELRGGLNELKDNTTSFNNGMTQLEQGQKDLTIGLNQSLTGTKALEEVLDESSKAAIQLSEGATSLAQGLQQVVDLNPQLAKDPSIQMLLQSSEELALGIKKSSEGQKLITEEVDKLVNGQEELVGGMNLVSEKLTEAKNGVEQLDAGVLLLVEGSGKLDSGLTEMSSGINQFSDNSFLLADGSVQLEDGVNSLVGGSGELSTKLNEAATETSKIQGTESLYQMFASPIQIVEEKYTEVPNYGTGFTPYFLSLGLFVGCLLLTIVIPIREPALSPSSGFSWYFSKTVLVSFIVILQAIVAVSVLIYGLNVEVQSIPLFYMYSILTSLTYMSLIQFLVTVLHDAGRFVAIVLLILQLTTSAGTFPLELIPSSLQTISTWLPMTYSVTGFKEIISGGVNYSVIWQEAAIVQLSFISIFSVLTLIYFIYKYKKMKNGTVSNTELSV
ncbi:YhgE/Pip family protein [Chengkuizengella sediminis]|uniref:YhgE/Pip family protein n=1 Tax=Chengkuizengella sediminis TaxID=1885917 RepID=UPI00138A3685|nr:YhgE/Pip domain-containing protein [Chengkuizengella sediminis]NDI35391.1 YhgE/Pip domain-containing protein [Chengkuizengella sediminis]